MKCGKCGKNEANYYYRETVNGVSREIRLCEECAKEEGLQERFSRGFDFGPAFGFGRSFFEDFFSPFESFFGLTRQPMTLGARSAEAEQKQSGEQQTENARSCESELKARRERNILEQQLKDAVAREDYEKAIELRDALKKMKE
ncbi:MAG: UvrB/UvrC motif-containing protein [Clostridiales bacterium]|nr:UvrB/UvrC motif-containing protein [Candidatus Apopatocola equi]MCQ2439962.1 UvrB/UvrC motif-containing protein [Oscillospiraceae bacterium]